VGNDFSIENAIVVIGGNSVNVVVAIQGGTEHEELGVDGPKPLLQ
jgi:hypothetical protein